MIKNVQTIQQDKRIEWVDVAKGITILLVIAGHTGIDNRVRGLIYSFHMVVFFIVSGWTMKMSMNTSQFLHNVKKNCKRLLFPVIGIFIAEIIISIVYGLRDMINYDASEVLKWLIGHLEVLLFSSGDYVLIGEKTINPIGLPWFFVVLFFGKTLYDLFHLLLCSKVFYPFIIILSFVGVKIGRICSLPFSLDIVLAIMVLLFAGQIIKHLYEIICKKYPVSLAKEWIFMFVMMGMWIATYNLILYYRGSYLEFAGRRYPFYPICYICGICGTICVFELSRLIVHTKTIQSALSFLGRNTMSVLIVHCFDKQWQQIYYVSENVLIVLLVRIIADISIVIIIEEIRRCNFARRLFKKVDTY